MKFMTKFLVAFGVLAVLGLVAPRARAAESQHREITAWVDSPTGSHLGGGYASTFLTNIRAKTIGNDDPKLRNAIDAFEALGMLQVRGLGLVPAAVASLTDTPLRKIIVQQNETGLSYGELLIANSLATKSGQSLTQIISMRAKTRSWGELAKQLRIDPDLLVDSARVAAQRIVKADFRTRQRPAQGLSYSGPNVHEHFRAQRY